MNDIYLSIDLDYWRYLTNPNESSFDLLNVLSSINIDTTVVNSHEKLLASVNNSKCTTLINVDFHSDLADDNPELEFNEGTWVNFVKWQTIGNYIWMYPNHFQCVENQGGLCHCENFDPFVDKYCGWKNVERRLGYIDIFNEYILNNIKAIGITTSYDWLGDEQFNASYLSKLIKCGKKQSVRNKIGNSFNHKIKLKDVV